MRFPLHILITILFLATSDVSERIAWNPERILKWSDFKGSPSTAGGWAASTSSGMSQAYELDSNGFLNKAGTVVTAHFYPEYSWVRHREKSNHLLGHEQTHFDITELHARKLQSRINAFQFTSNSKEEVRQLYVEVEEQRIVMQRQFDKETEHSTNHPNELKWKLKVERLLEDRTK